MSLGTIHALVAQDVCQRGETKAGVDGDSLVASWEELDAVPIALFRLCVWTLLLDGLWNRVRVHDLRVRQCEGLGTDGACARRTRRRDGAGKCAHHAWPWREAANFGEDDVTKLV